MLRELTEFHKPDKILHRNQQILEIKRVFKNFKEFGMASNLLIQGFSGAGKTASITNILDQENGDYIFVSGSENKTSYKLLKSLFDLNFNTVEKTLTEGIRKLKENPKVIVIDEINKLKNGSEIKDLFDNLNTIHRGTGCPVILITNTRGIIGLMARDAQLTLMFEKIEFKPYSVDQLQDILGERVLLLKNKGIKIVIPESFIEKICAAVFTEMDSSVRMAMKILQKCLLNNDFSEKALKKSLESVEVEDWREFFNTLSEIQKRSLLLISKFAPWPNKIASKEMFKHFNRYTPRRVLQIIDVFEEFGIIKSDYENKGRAGGNKRFISFTNKNLFDRVNDFIEDHGINL
ncbi:MAG TPA: AAA family ATPase [Candidatus Pacearchaeota archaeon]|nr:AAA family ATPase [Candidatus Pacearchaeota archaeon]